MLTCQLILVQNYLENEILLYIPIRLSHCVIAANFTTKAFMFFSVRNAPKVLLEKKAQRYIIFLTVFCQ